MCISAAIVAGVAIASSAVQYVSTTQTINANMSMAKYEGQLRDKELTDRANVERLAALEAENIRRDDYARGRSAAFAVMGASGIGENISFFQGIDPESNAAFLRDVRNIRLGLVQQQSVERDQRQANAYGVRIAKANAGAQRIGAVASLGADVAKAASYYNTKR